MSVSILTIDDETDIIDLFRQHFRREVRQGVYVLHFACSADEALAKLTDGLRPQLIVIPRAKCSGRCRCFGDRSGGVDALESNTAYANIHTTSGTKPENVSRLRLAGIRKPLTIAVIAKSGLVHALSSQTVSKRTTSKMPK